MKNRIIQRIAKELLSKDSDCRLAVSQFNMIYTHKNIIEYIKRILRNYKSADDIEYALRKLSKLLKQMVICPNSDQYRVDPDLFEQLKDEQGTFNPLNWITAELDFLTSVKPVLTENRDFYTYEEMLVIFGSESSVYRRVKIDDLPCAQLGDTKIFSKTLFHEYIEKESYNYKIASK